jgi:hypothetical protein
MFVQKDSNIRIILPFNANIQHNYTNLEKLKCKPYARGMKSTEVQTLDALRIRGTAIIYGLGYEYLLTVSTLVGRGKSDTG